MEGMVRSLPMAKYGDLDGQARHIDKLVTVDGRERQEFRRLRDEAGMTQRDLAERIGVTPATISNVETGRHPQLRRSHYAKLRRALGAGGRATDIAEAKDALYRGLVGDLADLEEKELRLVAAIVRTIRTPD